MSEDIKSADVTRTQLDALRLEAANYHTLFETMVQGVVYHAASGEIIAANPAAERVLGLSLSQMQGRTSIDSRWRAIHEDGSDFPGDTHPAMIALQTGKPVLGKIMGVFNPKVNDYVWISVNAVPQFQPGESQPFQVYATFEDITDRKKAEIERQKLNEEIRRKKNLESLGILAGSIAHDFNNLLTALFGNISLAKAYLAPSDKAYQLLTKAEDAMPRATGLTAQLLTFAKGGDPVKETVDLGSAVRDILDFPMVHAAVELSVSEAHNLWPVELDTGQFCQALNHLVNNAADAMPGGGRVQIHSENVHLVDLDAEVPPGRYLKVTVTDEGVGIAADKLGQIFDPYFTTKSTHVGLGLTVTHSVVQRHDGHITVESVVGDGTQFAIYLPAKPVETQTVVRADDAVAVGHILVMDDEEIIREVAGAMLTELGHTVEFATDGAEAIQRYRQAYQHGAPFDAVILDLTIPNGMGGKTAVKRLLEINPQAKIVVSSGYSSDPVIANYQAYGFRGRIIKPYHFADFSKTISDMLRPA